MLGSSWLFLFFRKYRMSFSGFFKALIVIFIAVQLGQFVFVGARYVYDEYRNPKTKVGVVKIDGAITDERKVTKKIEKFFKNDSIKAIVLSIDSPGSTAGVAELIGREINALKAQYEKPIITYVRNVCASGAYWVASTTEYIVCPGTAMVGSIGVYFPYLFQLDELAASYKIKYNSLHAGRYKTAGDPFKPMTDAERKLLQQLLDSTYDQFVDVVAHGRNLSPRDHEKWANGKIFTGAQALKIGLVDELGSWQTIDRVVKDRAEITTDIEWIVAKESDNFMAKLFESFSDKTTKSLVRAVYEQLIEHKMRPSIYA